MKKEETEDIQEEENTNSSLQELDLELQDHMDWWPDLSDLDRLNILGAHREDRARLLASKDSKSVESIIKEISRRLDLTYVDDFVLSSNPTKILPLRLIHSYSCLPIDAMEPSLQKPKVLCVDDEEGILKGFQLHLRNDFEVHVALSGDEGIEIFKKEGGFSIVLSDMRMPGMSGSSMITEIRKMDPKIVCVLITGHSDFEIAKDAINSGQVFKILTKPCPAEELIEVLKQGIQHSEGLIESKLPQNLQGNKVHLLTLWPPTPRMSRWSLPFRVKSPFGILAFQRKLLVP